MRQGFSGKAAIAGVGMTELSRASGRTELDLATEASRGAIEEAGRTPDAILSYHLGDSAPVIHVARELRIELGWHNEIYGGGTQSASILGDAAMLIDAGLARTVLVYRALNGRSGRRMNTLGLRLGEGVEEQFTHPYGTAGDVTRSFSSYVSGPLYEAAGMTPGDVDVALLSEGYVHGLNNVAEAVRQLRGDGVNQVPGAEVALCAGFGGSYGSAAILTR
jgi:acetyl-CoA acetyltransferase